VAAFNEVQTLLSRNDRKLSNSNPPRMMFLSDGDSQALSFDVFKNLVKNYPDLQVDWVLYGNTKSGEQTLRKLASIKGSFSTVPNAANFKEFLVTFSANIR